MQNAAGINENDVFRRIRNADQDQMNERSPQLLMDGIISPTGLEAQQQMSEGTDMGRDILADMGGSPG